MAAIRYQVSQNDVKSLSNPARITAIGGDNGTEFNLFFRDMPPGSQWVFPFTYGFILLVDSPSPGRAIQVDASQTPPGGQTPPTTSKIAQLVAYDTDQVANAGLVSSAIGQVRWNISAAPAGGAQASATKAGSTGVTHVCDSALFSVGSTGAPVPLAMTFSIIDGVSNNLSTGVTSQPATAGFTWTQSLGPGLEYRGAPGNGLNIAFGSGTTNTFERVSMSGFDQ